MSKEQTQTKTEFTFDDGEAVLTLKKDGFYYKGERIDDIHDVYNRFNAWLLKAEKKQEGEDVTYKLPS